MSAVLLRTESASSSQIEEITAGVRQLALAELGESRSPNANTVVGNVRAMEAALALSDHIDIGSILAMHAALLTAQAGWEQHAGMIREQPVWIGGHSPVTAAFVPPHAERVVDALTDLIAFIDRDDVPVVAQAAIAHAQFETIHPFVDGNGRTGRALLHAILRAKGLLTHASAPVSAGLLRDTAAYFDALTSYRDGDVRPLIECFAAASRFAATSGTALVGNLLGELEASRTLLAGLRPQSKAWEVVPNWPRSLPSTRASWRMCSE
jgi:Fic family protein